MRPMDCYEAIDRMGDVLEGSLAAEARAGFEAHMDECAACRTYLDQLRVAREALRAIPQPTGTSPRRSDLIATFRREFGVHSGDHD